MTLILYSLITLILLAVAGKYSWRTFQAPRDVLIFLSGAFVLSSYALKNQLVVFVPRVVFIMLGIMIVWWFISSILSTHSYISFRNFIVFTGVILLCASLDTQYQSLGIGLVVATGVINSIIAILQNKFKYQPKWIIIDPLHHYAIGLVGNENMLGSFLTPCVFMSIYMGLTNSYLWFIASALMLYTIGLTRCKTAFVGVFTGGLITSVYFLGFVYGGALILMLTVLFIIYYLLPHKKISFAGTAKERINYWRVALKQIKRTPIFGVGFDVFQTRVPYIQKEINTQTNGEFLSLKNYECPYPQKCHNDILQIALDTGIIGIGLWIAVITVGLSYINLSNLCQIALIASFVSLLTCGLFFHTLHIRVTNILFWFLFFVLMRNSDIEPMTLEISPTGIYACLAMYVILGLSFLGRYIMHDFYMQKYFRSKLKIPPTKALEYYPNSTAAHTFCAQFYVRSGDTVQLLKHSIQALIHYDGEQRLWELWCNLGLSCYLHGAFLLARQCYNISLEFWPHYEQSKKGLEDVKQMITQVGAIQFVPSKKGE